LYLEVLEIKHTKKHGSVFKMPSVSQKQHKFMAWAASSPENAAKAGIAQGKAAEFVHADRGWKGLAKKVKHGRGKS
jgi:hypothetical protein